ncbi:dienelactone hydrolase [Flavobacteriaceae bacterium]|jgi:predicted dienelactone hydrolase|nr:dienelactone hydrolase [Flavobacteriaceae bacterium]
MKKNNQKMLFVFVFFLSLNLFSQADRMEFVYGDKLPDAPLLSSRGDHQVGVMTMNLVHSNQIDILKSSEDNDVFYDRPLTVEVWYPAKLKESEVAWEVYDEVMGNLNDPKRPLIPFKFYGRAKRNAKPLESDKPYPLIIVSHGYTGSRLLFTYLTENMASKGYVVVSIDHTDSTFRDASPFNSTLLNRSLDDLFVLNEMERLSKDSDSFLFELLDANNTGLVGYSMGGYGALNVGGAGYSPQAAQFFKGISKGRTDLEQRMIGNPVFEASFDTRIKAIVAMAPWGMANGVWDQKGLEGLKIPTFFVAGSKDDISGYENGIKAIYDGAVNAERYMLTYVNARHNIAPNPPPVEALQEGLHIDEYLRYADSVWDQRRINNINQHFITAFLGAKLKSQSDYLNYLDAEQFSDDEPWHGFLPRTSIGLELYYKKGN